MGKNYESEANPSFIFIVVAKMVKCTDAKFMAFWKKSSKKREPRASEEAKAISEVEAIPIMLILAVAATEVPEAPSEVLGSAEVREPVEVHNAAEMLGMAEVFAGEGSHS